MLPETRDRLFGFQHAFDEPVTLVATLVLAALLVIAPAVIAAMHKAGRTDERRHKELMERYYWWLVIVPVVLVPILAGAFWTIFGVGVLSLLCYREYARVTGLFREKLTSFLVVVAIIWVTYAALDNWYRLFVALTPLTIASLAAAAIWPDQPKGYIQRAALGVFGFALFGSCLGQLGYLANDVHYRSILILVWVSVEANDVVLYLAGKPLGQRKLCPNTSPYKTVAGAAGAVIFTMLLFAGIGWFVFAGTRMQAVGHLLGLGALVGVVSQFGELTLSSIKRDLGIKGTGATIPGGGGLLDRCDNILFVAPTVFHYVNYVAEVGLGQATHIFSGG